MSEFYFKPEEFKSTLYDTLEWDNIKNAVDVKIDKGIKAQAYSYVLSRVYRLMKQTLDYNEIDGEMEYSLPDIPEERDSIFYKQALERHYRFEILNDVYRTLKQELEWL